MLFLFFFAGFIYAQEGLGINTLSPKATLDITATNDVATADGVLVPRLTLAELTAKGDGLYGADQNGVLIYITDVSGGNAAAQRVNIGETGHYFFDSASNTWKKLNGNGWRVVGEKVQATLNTQDIYHNGKVAMGDFSTVSMTATHQLDVNGNIRIRSLSDGKARTEFPYSIVGNANGVLASSRGNYRVWRGAINITQAVMTEDDDALNIFSANANIIAFPPNPKLGKVITIRIDGASFYNGSNVTYSVVTPGVTPTGYLPMNYVTNTSVVAADYKTTIKPKTAITVVWTGMFGSGGLGWVQIGGNNQVN